MGFIILVSQMNIFYSILFYYNEPPISWNTEMRTLWIACCIATIVMRPSTASVSLSEPYPDTKVIKRLTQNSKNPIMPSK